MSVPTITNFVATGTGKFGSNLNPRQKKILVILAKACTSRDLSSGTNYVSSDATAKQLILDAATATKGMTRDQVIAARIYNYGVVAGVSSWPSTLALALSRARFWEQLDDDTLDRMELVIDFGLTAQ